jgi:hypothetical protein
MAIILLAVDVIPRRAVTRLSAGPSIEGYTDGSFQCESIVWLTALVVKIDGVVAEAINVLGHPKRAEANGPFCSESLPYPRMPRC